MGLITDCEELFGVTNLYELLNVTRNSSESVIKKAYRRLSLLVHPDRVGAAEKQSATQKFQVLSKAYGILSDREKRAAYDETGCVDDDDDMLGDKDWESYWRVLFPKLSTADIVNFMAEYRGSSEEMENLKKCYERAKGDFDVISETCMGYEFDEEDRYRKIINQLIADGELEAYPKFTKETKKKRDARRNRFLAEAKEAEAVAESEEVGGLNALANAIAKRQRSREADFGNLMDRLEAKYCKPKKKKSTK